MKPHRQSNKKHTHTVLYLDSSRISTTRRWQNRRVWRQNSVFKLRII